MSSVHLSCPVHRLSSAWLFAQKLVSEVCGNSQYEPVLLLRLPVVPTERPTLQRQSYRVLTSASA